MMNEAGRRGRRGQGVGVRGGDTTMCEQGWKAARNS